VNPLRLRHLVGEAISRERLWEEGHAVAVAVSGGIDSVVLLDVLCETRRWHRGILSVVTIDHGVRPGSAADVLFVQSLAAERGLPVQSFAPPPRGTSEAALREQRYAVLDALPTDRVALGHHRDDLAETVLIRLMRGTGTVGLAAMRPRRGRYTRPLLEVGRSEIQAYAQARGLRWVDDPTNQQLEALRNQLRHQVLPLLEQLRPGTSGALARSARAAARDDDFVTSLLETDPTAQGPPWSRAFVNDRPEPLVRRALQKVAPGLGLELIDAVRQAAARGAGRVDTAQGVFKVCGDLVSWSPRTPQ
jgi:tRNA(Ile)-lysidine synthase